MVQRKVVRGARIVRYENGKRASYTDGALIWLTDVELAKFQFITEPVPAPTVKVPAKEAVKEPAATAPVTAEKQETKHEVRNTVPPTAFTPKK